MVETTFKKSKNLSDQASSFGMSSNGDAETQAQSSSAADDASFKAAMEAFMNYKPAYSAEQFEKKVCAEIADIKEKYEQAEITLQSAMETNQKTLETCEAGLDKIDSRYHKDTKMLNKAFHKIGHALAQEMTRDY